MLIGNAIFSLFEVTKVCFELMKYFNSELFVLFSKLDILSIKDCQYAPAEKQHGAHTMKTANIHIPSLPSKFSPKFFCHTSGHPSADKL